MALFFQRVFAVPEVRHYGILVVQAFGDTISLRQILLVYFIALFVARRRVSLFWKIIVSVAASGFYYKIIGLLQEVFWLLN